LRSTRIVASTLLLLAGSRLWALVPTYTNLGSPAGTFGAQEQFLINGNVFAQDWSLTNLPTPTGTIYFTVNGLPVGSPFPISAEPTDRRVAAGQGLVSFSLPGTYQLVSHYSGDAYYAPSTSTYSFPVDIQAKPARFGFSPAASSLTFASGATTGNTVPVSFIFLNGFHGTQQMSCTVIEKSNEPQASAPASCAMPSLVGNDGLLLTIKTVSPQTVPAVGRLRERSFIALPAMALVFFVPFALRRRSFASFFALSLVLICISGCSAGSTGMTPSPQPTRTITSAGHYTVYLTGLGWDQATGQVTLAQPAEVSVTVQ
jgi:Bacterial Ig-like domain (group 3)